MWAFVLDFFFILQFIGILIDPKFLGLYVCVCRQKASPNLFLNKQMEMKCKWN